MRINLVTPFAEKDAAKALGARWDSTKKLWYIVDVADLTPFLRWIPNLEAATSGLASTDAQPTLPAETRQIKRSAGIITTSVVAAVHCGCSVLPWKDCEHTAVPQDLPILGSLGTSS
ncbi:MAG TPA: DUF5710 domain-containing protein [Rhodoferax sp.]|jgi:hypothetical protein|nr:DUF5710 domain-containing protein [Rhodoferax sp.]HNV60418.1 DUF5710 domain-containing protein [Rhodoferax sp.]HPW27840.1 DUF5710 domain-containing protein [Rhodoferax sp.]